MKPNHDKTAPLTFWDGYFSNRKSIVMLVGVCFLIAILTNLFNHLGLGVNMVFSLCFGVPISMLETFLRTRKKPMQDWLINILSVLLGCLLGTCCVYGYLVWAGYVPFGYFGQLFFVNFGIAFIFSAAAFYFFWSRYRNQELTLALKDQQLKAATLENLRQQSENRLLQSQMEPHFLFNTLANIQTLVDMDPKGAKTMIADLSLMLRSSLKNSSQDSCTVEQELALVRAYLSIQRVRIGERLKIQEDIDPALLGCELIPMIMQPLIENAIKHGVEKSIGNARIFISVRRDSEQLAIEITNQCIDPKNTVEGNGISLKNIEQRIVNRYGNSAAFSSQKQQSGWQNLITIPLNKMSTNP